MTPPADRPGPSVGLGDGAQAGDVRVDNVAGANIYHGVSAGDLLPMIADLLGNEAQWRRADSAAREIRQQYLDRRLDRMTLILVIIGGVLIVQAVLLLITIGVTVALLWPRLAALVLIGSLS